MHIGCNSIHFIVFFGLVNILLRDTPPVLEKGNDLKNTFEYGNYYGNK